MSTQITNIADFRSNMAQFIQQIEETGNPMILVRHGDPVVAVIPGQEIEGYQKWKEQSWLYTDSDSEEVEKFDALSKQIEEDWQGKNSDLTHTAEQIDALSF